MKPPIDATQFGSITLGGAVYDHDVLVCPDATVKRRKKKLSKAVYGTPHTIYACPGAGGAVAFVPRAQRGRHRRDRHDSGSAALGRAR
jgi:hypothetical protein